PASNRRRSISTTNSGPVSAFPSVLINVPFYMYIYQYVICIENKRTMRTLFSAKAMKSPKAAIASMYMRNCVLNVPM
ncbi:MAG: hypothetical protein ABF893_17580, partial [Gluconacetobacter liquefaciens]